MTFVLQERVFLDTIHLAGMMFHFWIKEGVGGEERDLSGCISRRSRPRTDGRAASHEENGSPILSRCRGQFGGLDPLCDMEIRLEFDFNV